MTTTLYIKNMVCPRCIKVVRDELLKLDLTIEAIELGYVRVSDPLSDDQMDRIRNALKENGFELIGDKKGRLIDRVKTLIIEKIHYSENGFASILPSNFLSKELGHDYSYLSNLFSSVEGTTIEKYIINQKIEKVKELLVYNELTLSEIAYRMGYSSVQHLSGQFKKVTGLTPSHFKKCKEHKRKPIDEI
ncbi:MAG TPA: helix-turn-helix domain-containing protein [Prolixibacteraceae bacterium]|nr:helix-turn-helix domain-containing protein [Prolixibacteraceae bacterium]